MLKKIIFILLTAALISMLAVGCSSKQKQDPSPAPQSQSTSAPSDESKQEAPAEKTDGSADENDTKAPEIIEATGTYNGRVDTTFIEIKLDSTGKSMEFSIQELGDDFTELKTNDRVKITYIVNEHKQHILKSIEKIQ